MTDYVTYDFLNLHVFVTHLIKKGQMTSQNVKNLLKLFVKKNTLTFNFHSTIVSTTISTLACFVGPYATLHL